MLDVAEAEATQDSPKMGAVSTLTTPHLQTGLLSIIHKSVAWLVRLFLRQILTATAMAHYDEHLAAGKKNRQGRSPACVRTICG